MGEREGAVKYRRVKRDYLSLYTPLKEGLVWAVLVSNLNFL
jgi:hypothetical protein